MGCDIHLSVERRNPESFSGAWETVLLAEGQRPFYDGRNYDLFAILANVRNGVGFAGVDTGDGFIPIAEPRGVPADASIDYLAEVKSWDGDGHSHSYFTVAELDAFDWTKETKHRGFIPLPEYFEWKRWKACRGEGPSSWCGGTSADKVTLAEAEFLRGQYEGSIAKDGHEGGKKFLAELKHAYVQVEWSEPYYESAGLFLSHTVPRLRALGKPEDVRIVFFFDN